MLLVVLAFSEGYVELLISHMKLVSHILIILLNYQVFRMQYLEYFLRFKVLTLQTFLIIICRFIVHICRKIPYVGLRLQSPLKEFLTHQKIKLHNPDSSMQMVTFFFSI